MDINELENLRIKILKEIHKLKIKYFLYTLLIPIILISYNQLVLGFFNLAYKQNQKFDITVAINPTIDVISVIVFAIFLTYIYLRDERKFIIMKEMFFLFLPYILFFGLAQYTKVDFPYITAIYLTLFAMFVSYLAFFNLAKNDKIAEYKKAFKLKYLKPMFLKEGYEYETKGNINLKFIRNSLIFGTKEISGGDDKISGKVDNIEFELSDIMVHNSINFSTFGVFFYAEFNKKVKFTTFITTKKYKLQDYGFVSDKITMDDTEFNKFFDVYSNDVQNAMYILSPAFMQRLTQLRQIFNSPIIVSFFKSKIYIFIDTKKDSFEPNIDISATQTATTIIKEFTNFLSIVKILNLNTKIWKI
ncbi:DUF3137 domain-containing protein [Campylobacter sp. JMF_04 NA10]|uniref:DUF3137 domain-containing protein n=1 Tax=Campylobacter sp. JMF_04 NA10 TaxID=2983824 RepID=UPI0022E9AC83|nr:DUF3137 domain-containing protein [Campylobacter sp. JMF_04 NA10]MDA3075890.1 DUF3137 domain-containing protein [Campylobacter sp. JMF_04 NA10]